jgi:hypothetical protein
VTEKNACVVAHDGIGASPGRRQIDSGSACTTIAVTAAALP